MSIHSESRGTGPTVVLLPGIGLPGSSWGEVADRLADSHRVVTIDPRGSGRSGAADERYTREMMAADVLGCMPADGPVHLVGLSMGGMIAQEVALAAPESLRSLVLLSTYGAPDAWSGPEYEVRQWLLADRGLEAQLRLSSLLLFGPRVIREEPETTERARRMFATAGVSPVGYGRQMEFMRAHDRLADLTSLAVPTLVLGGAEDLVCPPQQSVDLHHAIAGSRLEIHPRGSHALWLQDPGWVVDRLGEFWTGLP